MLWVTASRDHEPTQGQTQKIRKSFREVAAARTKVASRCCVCCLGWSVGSAAHTHEQIKVSLHSLRERCVDGDGDARLLRELGGHQRVICRQRPWPTNDGPAAAVNGRLNPVMTELRTKSARSGLQREFVAGCASAAAAAGCCVLDLRCGFSWRGGVLLVVPRARER